MTVVVTCDWCKSYQPVVAGGQAVQCGKCEHWFYSPLDEQIETLRQCQQCGGRCSSYADQAGKRCYPCTLPKP